MYERKFAAIRFALGFAGLIATRTVALAADGESTWCRNGISPSEQQNITLAHTVGAGRIHFYNDSGTSPGCPRLVDACRDRSYVIAGQEVLVGKRMPGFVCAYYPNKGGGSAGWIEENRLELEAGKPDKHPTLSAWVGRWLSEPDTISLRVKGNKLAGSGEAFWGSGKSENEGDFDGEAEPQGNRVVFADGSGPSDCRVTMVLVGPYLVVDDNNACGGMNVSFTSVYRRK